jgi:hypothetical protein
MRFGFVGSRRSDSSNPVPPMPAMIGWPNVIEDVDVGAVGPITLGLGRIGPDLGLSEKSVLKVASMGPRLGVGVAFAGAKLSIASKPAIKQRLKASKKRKLERLDSEFEFLRTVFFVSINGWGWQVRRSLRFGRGRASRCLYPDGGVDLKTFFTLCGNSD